MSSTPPPSPTPAPAPTPEKPSEGQYVIAVMSVVFGALLLLAAGILAIAGTTSEGGALPRYRYVAALGSGLVALGLALEFDRLRDLLRQRKSLHALNAVLMSLLAVVVVVLVNVLSVRYDFWRADLTSGGLYTLSDEARSTAAALDQDIRIVVLMPLESDAQFEPLDALLEQYEAASPRIRIERIELRKVTQRELTTLVQELDLGARTATEDELVGLVVQAGVRTEQGWQKARSEHIRLQDMWEQQEQGRTFLGEQKVSTAMLRVLEAKQRKLYFTTGHEEPSIDSFGDRGGLGYLSRMLRTRNLELATLNLSQVAAVPSDCDLLIVAGPRGPLSPSEVEKVTMFLDGGGDAVVCLEPIYNQRGGVDGMIEIGLEGYLKDELGITALSRELVRFEPRQGGPALMRDLYADEHDLAHPVTDALGRAAGTVTAYVTPRALATTPGTPSKDIVRVSENFAAAYYIKSTADPHAFSRDRRAPPDLQGGPFVLAAVAEKPADADPARKSRVMVVGDVDWLSNAVMQDPQFENLELFLRAADWAQEQQTKVIGKAARPKSYRLEVAPDAYRALLLFSLIGLPALSICLAMFAWLLRRR